MTVSVIIPVYNEEKVIGKCLESLSKQTKKPLEIIVVDDGSTDASVKSIGNLKSQISNLKILIQEHRGPGAARNLGAKQATSEILVFVDADMTFDKNFVVDLIKPIEQKQSQGTFTREEYVSNWDAVWARCWNYNNGISTSRRIPESYPGTAPVFRAIFKSEFMKVNGFSEGVGWTDDWSLSKKMGYEATVTSALCYHTNPATLTDVFKQARWIGKNEFLTNIFSKKVSNCVKYSLPVSLLAGLYNTIYYKTPEFFIFKLVYDLGIETGLLAAVFGRHKNK